MILEKAVQDYYPAETAICYGCGRSNPHGLHLKTYWNGEEGICRFTPQAYHTAFPGVIYGGLIASIMDCHCIGTAIAAMYQAEGRMPDTAPEITCVTGNLNVSYLKPTPVHTELMLKATIKQLHAKKAIVVCSLFANEVERAQCELVAVRITSRGGHQSNS